MNIYELITSHLVLCTYVKERVVEHICTTHVNLMQRSDQSFMLHLRIIYADIVYSANFSPMDPDISNIEISRQDASTINYSSADPMNILPCLRPFIGDNNVRHYKQWNM